MCRINCTYLGSKTCSGKTVWGNKTVLPNGNRGIFFEAYSNTLKSGKLYHVHSYISYVYIRFYEVPNVNVKRRFFSTEALLNNMDQFFVCFTLVFRQLWCEVLIDLPSIRNGLWRRPNANSQTSLKIRLLKRLFPRLLVLYMKHPKIGLQLHHKIVPRHPSINSKFDQRLFCILCHGI